MKNVNLLVWVTQLGLSTAVPWAGFIVLAVWLQNRFDFGSWVIFAGIGLGLFCAIDGLVRNMKALDRMSREKEKNNPPVSFGEHD